LKIVERQIGIEVTACQLGIPTRVPRRTLDFLRGIQLVGLSEAGVRLGLSEAVAWAYYTSIPDTTLFNIEPFSKSI